MSPLIARMNRIMSNIGWPITGPYLVDKFEALFDEVGILGGDTVGGAMIGMYVVPKNPGGGAIGIGIGIVAGGVGGAGSLGRRGPARARVRALRLSTSVLRSV